MFRPDGLAPRALGGGMLTGLVAVFAQAALFGLFHTYQGPAGILLTGIVGLGHGLVVRWTGGNLWIVVLAHGLTDTIGMTALYLDLPVV